MVVNRTVIQRNGLMSLITSIGIGTAAYRMMKPKNRVGQAVKYQSEKMTRPKKETYSEH